MKNISKTQFPTNKTITNTHRVLWLHEYLVPPYDAVPVVLCWGVPVHPDGARVDGGGADVLGLARHWRLPNKI